MYKLGVAQVLLTGCGPGATHWVWSGDTHLEGLSPGHVIL